MTDISDVDDGPAFEAAGRRGRVLPPPVRACRLVARARNGGTSRRETRSVGLRLRRDQILRMEGRTEPRGGGDAERSHRGELVESVAAAFVPTVWTVGTAAAMTDFGSSCPTSASQGPTTA